MPTDNFAGDVYPCRNCGHQLGQHYHRLPESGDPTCAECICFTARADAVVKSRDEFDWIMSRKYSGEALIAALEEYSQTPYTNHDLPVFQMTGAAARELRELREADAVASEALERIRQVLKEQWKAIPQQTRQDLRAALPGGSLET